MIAMTVHEFSHGWTAYLYGDDTAYYSGRLTFNPIPHIDLVGTIVLPALCLMSGMPVFGWAKPVPVNPLRLANFRKDMTKVALSGPASNLLLVIIAAAGFKMALLMPWLAPGIKASVLTAFRYAVIINLALAFFNLIPIAPLDGSQILSGLLSGKLRNIYEKHIPYSWVILIVLMMTGMLKYLILPGMYFTLALLAKIGLPVF